jgi:signal peptidase II
MYRLQETTGGAALSSREETAIIETQSERSGAKAPAVRTAILLLTAMLVLALDQLSKAAIRQFLEESGSSSVPILGGVVRLSYVENRGSAFGLFQNQTLFFIVVGVLVIAGILIVQRFIPVHRTALAVCLGMSLGGAAGNLVDRVRLGHVFDFVDLTWWPVFNVADSAIVIGVLILAYHLLTSPSHEIQAGGDRSSEADRI